ncbi:MAG: ribosome silencing factor [Eubacteriaceae bacterium]|nr:ribosome silencing factor [Eubacteriaceae bacterium]
MTNKEYALLAAKTLDNKKAIDITVIDIMEKASFADYMIIATGNSDRQVNSLVDDVEEEFAKEGLFAKSIDGKQNSGWILMDFGDIVVNIFNKETREKYNIERVWGDCTFIDFENGEN